MNINIYKDYEKVDFLSHWLEYFEKNGLAALFKLDCDESEEFEGRNDECFTLEFSFKKNFPSIYLKTSTLFYWVWGFWENPNVPLSHEDVDTLLIRICNPGNAPKKTTNLLSFYANCCC